MDLNKQGYIKTNERMETSISGVFAAGDVRDKELRQVATCVGDGAIAGVNAEKFIADMETFEHTIMQKNKVGLIYIYSAVDAIGREVLSHMQQIEAKMKGQIKLSIIDAYKGQSLCRMLGDACGDNNELGEGNLPAIVYTKNGEIVEISTALTENDVTEKLQSLLAE